MPEYYDSWDEFLPVMHALSAALTEFRSMKHKRSYAESANLFQLQQLASKKLETYLASVGSTESYLDAWMKGFIQFDDEEERDLYRLQDWRALQKRVLSWAPAHLHELRKPETEIV